MSPPPVLITKEILFEFNTSTIFEPPELNLFIVLHFIPFSLIVSEVPFVPDKENPSLDNLCAIPTISCLWVSLTDKNANPLVGKELEAAIWLFAIAIPKSSSKPITSPVDFISGPRRTSLSGNLLNGNTASLTANLLLVLYFSLYFDKFSPAIILDAIFAKEIPFAFDTNGTVLLALGFTSITKTSSFFMANWIFKNPLTFKANASFLVCNFNSFNIPFLIETGGRQQAESPEWIPASSICCIIPAI